MADNAFSHGCHKKAQVSTVLFSKIKFAKSLCAESAKIAFHCARDRSVTDERHRMVGALRRTT
jgi:hypothetical protein